MGIEGPAAIMHGQKRIEDPAAIMHGQKRIEGPAAIMYGRMELKARPHSCMDELIMNNYGKKVFAGA